MAVKHKRLQSGNEKNHRPVYGTTKKLHKNTDRRNTHEGKTDKVKQPGPKIIELFFILNPTEHKISTAHKN